MNSEFENWYFRLLPCFKNVYSINNPMLYSNSIMKNKIALCKKFSVPLASAQNVVTICAFYTTYPFNNPHLNSRTPNFERFSSLHIDSSFYSPRIYKEALTIKPNDSVIVLKINKRHLGDSDFIISPPLNPTALAP